MLDHPRAAGAGMKPLPPHTDQAHAVITDELRRLSLPHDSDTDRPELVAPLIEPAPRRPRRNR